MSLRYCHPLAYVDREIRLAPMSPRIEAFRIETLRGEAMRRRDAAVKRGADILLALAALTLGALWLRREARSFRERWDKLIEDARQKGAM